MYNNNKKGVKQMIAGNTMLFDIIDELQKTIISLRSEVEHANETLILLVEENEDIKKTLGNFLLQQKIINGKLSTLINENLKKEGD